MQLVISDSHAGLKAATGSVLPGAAWQRCRVHFLRNVLAQVPKGSAEMVAAAIRAIFAQPSAAQVRDQLGVIASMPGRQFPKVEAMLHEAADDGTAFAAFPVSHWKKIWSTNPAGTAEQGDQAPHRRRGGLPQPRRAAPPGRRRARRSHDEWQAGERRYLPEGSMTLLAKQAAAPEEVATPALLTA